MTFQQFRELLARLRGSREATSADVVQPPEEIARVDLREATRSEKITIKIAPENLVRLVLLAAGEPDRPWKDVTFFHHKTGGYSSIHGSMMSIWERDAGDSEVNVSISYASSTQPLTYAPLLGEVESVSPQGSAEPSSA